VTYIQRKVNSLQLPFGGVDVLLIGGFTRRGVPARGKRNDASFGRPAPHSLAELEAIFDFRDNQPADPFADLLAVKPMGKKVPRKLKASRRSSVAREFACRWVRCRLRRSFQTLNVRKEPIGAKSDSGEGGAKTGALAV
jgi:hypothetical protein